MGDSSVDPKIIKKTQDTLGKVIKKPPMSEKILSRPTVQYMYDVLISVSMLKVEIFAGILYSVSRKLIKVGLSSSTKPALAASLTHSLSCLWQRTQIRLK